tara:strand:+ start:925 stop:2355 length:1431 start_codon:yes stop_codon:yes gene_type:complete
MKKIIFFLFFYTSFIFFFGCSEKIKSQPNVIFILTDDQGYQDLSCYNASNIYTPNIDFLANNGARFTSYYASNPVCSASRASILTGCYAERIGVFNAYMPNSKYGLNPKETTIAELLKKKKYTTGIFGKWHLGDAPEFLPRQHGFDEFYGILYSNDMWPKHPQQGSIFNFSDIYLYENENRIKTINDQSYLTQQLTEKTISFIEKNKEKPFFLLLAHPQPHVPLFVSPSFKGKSKRDLYGDVIQEIDDSVGQIINTLKTYNLENNTIIIFTSDNGPWLSYGGHSGSAGDFREGKGTNWEGGHRVPGIVYYPNEIESNTVINAPAMGIDWLPTIADFTNTPLPKNKIDGLSLVPLLKKQTTKSPHKNFFFYYRVNELHAIRHNNWKLYLPHTYRSLNGRKGTNNGIPIKYDMNEIKFSELYNLSNDPSEKNNLATTNQDVVLKIEKIADSIRYILGDKLKGIKGKEVRPVGISDFFN